MVLNTSVTEPLDRYRIFAIVYTVTTKE